MVPVVTPRQEARTVQRQNKKQHTLVRLIALAAIYPGVTSADAVQAWNAMMWTTTAAQNPFLQVRFAAITHLAVFDAVNAITGDYQPYLGPVTAPQGASPDAAAVAAAHRVLSTYFPGSAQTLDLARAASLASIPDGPAEDDGIQVWRGRGCRADRGSCQ